MALFYILSGVTQFLNLLMWLLIIDALLSWILSPFNKVRQILQRITTPLRAPFVPLSMKLVRSGLPLDLSGLFAMIALQILIRLIYFIAGLVL